MDDNYYLNIRFLTKKKNNNNNYQHHCKTIKPLLHLNSKIKFTIFLLEIILQKMH